MEPTRSRVQGEKAKAGSWKDRILSNKQKILNETEFYELDLKIKECGLTGNMGGKNEIEPHNQASGHGTKVKSLTKHSKWGVSRGIKKTPEEQVNKEAKGQGRNEDSRKEPVTVPKSTKGPSSGVVARSQTGRVVKGSDVQSGSRSVTGSGTSLSGISVSDYIVLLKSLRINLTNGVLNPEVIMLSQNADIIQKASDIVKELENFKLQFNSIPRLGCREVKNSLSLKDNKNILEITLRIFFEKRDDSGKDLRTQWENNVSNTKCEFKFRDKYKTMAISTPAMYATAQTRSWRHLESGDHLAVLSEGVTLKISDIEKSKYCDESTLWKTPSSQKFGKYFQNPADECECLKFYHELREIDSNRGLKYTKGNKVEFGFLSGRLDFLAEIKNEKIVIECKGTTGDMVGKVFTKPKNYVRNYVRKNMSIQQKINELCVFCEEEVLACFLAVLNLIFQKDA